MKILLVKLSAFGDVVQTLPVAMAIRHQMPDVRLDWLVEPAASGILLGHPALDNVLISPRGRLKGSMMGKMGQMWGFRDKLQSTRYDAVLDLQGLIKSGILVSLSRGGRKIGFSGGKEPAAALALNEKLPPYDPDRHALQRYLDLLEPLGLQRPAVIEYGLEPTAAEEEQVDGLLRGLDHGRPLVVMHPVALWDSKLWPMDLWAALAAILAGQGCNMVITGTAADRPWAEAMVKGCDAAVAPRDLTGKTEMRILAALMKRADAVVSTDTGGMHLAAAMDTPVVALFGPTAPWRTGPFGQVQNVIRLGLDCSPCFKRTCDDPRCMSGITPESVANAVTEKLEQKQIAVKGSQDGPE